VDGAIHRAAGPQLLEELRQYSFCRTGDAVVTKGYCLPARYVIHAVGPVWHDGNDGEDDLLANAYESSFARAGERGDIRTIAFPAISTGVYGFPKQRAAGIAVAAMKRHEPEFAEVIACLFDEEARQLYEQILK
jgi:O-acetyl-ADP-ribose deacetylase (regulator of RNase III)